MGVMNTAGSAFNWFEELFSHDLGDSSKRLFEKLDEEAELVGAGAGELLFLPYLNGERCPYDDPRARGAFVGLTRSHGRGHMARSIMEGVGFALRDIAAIMGQRGAGSVYLSGGGARSSLWRQIVADVLNREVVTMAGAAYGGALGAAFIAGTGLGIWESVEQTASTLRINTRQTPVPQNAARYDLLYPIYHNLYEILRGTFHSLTGLSEHPEWKEQALNQERRIDRQISSERTGV
jgi:xylulokinase